MRPRSKRGIVPFGLPIVAFLVIYVITNKFIAKKRESPMAELYSVWALAPTSHPGLQQAKEHLQSIYGGPDFEPHVTVLGRIPLPSAEEGVARLQTLAKSLGRPVSYPINGVGNGGTYFQSVFLTVDPTPQVVEVNAKAKKVFQMAESENTVYFPHLSLLYGDLKDDDKKRAKALAEEKFGDTLVDSEFVVSSLSLWLTNSDDKLLSTWKKIAEVPLQADSIS